MFQSPQWGSNSKGFKAVMGPKAQVAMFQSPQWGSNSKDIDKEDEEGVSLFQSPQWGSNSKG